jgi:hypothetical protein
MSNSVGILNAPFFKWRRSFLLAMLGNWFGSRAVFAQAEQGVSASAAKAPQKKNYHMVVLTNPVAGKEDEFNRWYTNRHIPDVLACPGFVRAQRFEMVAGMGENPWRYCAIYEIEADDPATAVKELVARHGTDKLQASDALDPNSYAVVYEAMGPVVAKKG